MTEGPFFVGRDLRTGAFIGVNGKDHFSCFARNQAGKGSGIIIPNLIRYLGSCVTTDPNLENTNITAHPCAIKGFKTVLLDPYEKAQGPAAQYRGRYNLVPELDPESRTFPDDLWAVAEGSIPEPISKNDNSAHFVSGARELWSAAVGHIRTTERPEHQHLPRVRERIEREGRAFFAEALGNTAGHGVIAAGAQRLFDAGENEAASFMSTLRDETRWIASPVMKTQLSSSSFRMDELHSGRMRLYIGLPGGRVSFQRNWMRLLIEWAFQRLGDLQGLRPASGHPVLFQLDEFGTVVGHLTRLDRSLGEVRHYNAKLAVYLQGLDQLKKHYPSSWQSFLQNMVPCFFGINEYETAEYVAKSLGDRIFYDQEPGFSLPLGGERDRQGSINAGDRRQREPYWTPEETMRNLAPASRLMLLLTRPRPALVERVPYWELFEKSAYDANPKYA